MIKEYLAAVNLCWSIRSNIQGQLYTSSLSTMTVSMIKINGDVAILTDMENDRDVGSGRPDRAASESMGTVLNMYVCTCSALLQK